MTSSSSDRPMYDIEQTYSWIRHPQKRLLGQRFKVSQVVVSRHYIEHEKNKNVQYLDITKGTGRVASHGQQVAIRYEFFEHKKCDPVISTYNDKPYKVWLQSQKICDGLGIGIEGMREGGVRRIVVLPGLSCRRKFGCLGCRDYRFFDVELISIEN